MIKRPTHGTREHFIYIELATRKKLGIGRKHILDGLPLKFHTTRGHIWDVYQRYIRGKAVEDLK
jgi:hypothetical protein